jgi:hypothetical protein
MRRLGAEKMSALSRKGLGQSEALTIAHNGVTAMKFRRKIEKTMTNL